MTSMPSGANALMDIAPRPDVIFACGKGSFLYDTQGRRYLDFIQGWAVNCLGHSPDAIVETLQAQAGRLLTPSPAFYNDRSLELAEALVARSCLDEVFFTNSGAEANEGAIKLARKFGSLHRDGAHEIVTFEGGFHGRSLATMSASGKAAFGPLFEPKVPGFRKARLGDIASVERLLSADSVAVMLEPIQGEAGVIPADSDFLRDLRALTRERGLLLILDEVQTGIGRTGRLFDYERAGIEPDIMTLGKGLGGGVPLGAMLATREVSCFEHGDQGGTFNGSPLMCAVGLEILRRVGAPEFLANVLERSAYLTRALQALAAARGLGRVRGEGLLLALDLTRPIAADVAAAARNRGLLINAPQPDTLRFVPSLVVTEAEIDGMAETLAAALDAVLELTGSRPA